MGIREIQLKAKWEKGKRAKSSYKSQVILKKSLETNNKFKVRKREWE